MKYIKSYILFALMGLAVTSCTLNDLKDDVDNLKDRVALIEQQVKLLNDNLAVAGFVLDPQNKLITNIEEKDGQFVIELTNGDKLNLTIGKPGTVNEPVITIEEGYWVINGSKTNVKAAGENGKNGEGFPEFRVEAGKWQVRFGEGAWADVQGGQVEGVTGSLGDQIFESAQVDGKNFIVTLKDGNKVVTLPIVEKLACAIDDKGLELAKGGYLEMEAGTRVVIPVKINGDDVQVTYPQGWRATLTSLAAADEKGNNYQLSIFAPNAEPKLAVRANAESAADVCVLVQKGNFWAVDKIKVRLKKEAVVAKSDLEKYNAGQSIRIGGLEISKKLYGEATVVEKGQAIEQGGVYFINADNVELTYDLKSTPGVENLIILPATDEIKNAQVKMNTQVYLKGTFAAKRVYLKNMQEHYPLRLNNPVGESKELNVVLEQCKIDGLAGKKGLAMKGDATQMNLFVVTKSDIKLASTGVGLYLLTQVPCTKMEVSDNLIYAAKGVSITDFKIFNGNTLTIDDLVLSQNTLVDVESSGGSVYGLVRAKKVNQAVVENNIYWLSDAVKNAYFFTGESAGVASLRCKNNAGFSVSGKTMKMFQKGAFDQEEVFMVKDLFTTSDVNTFNKETGVFKPTNADYKNCGAQR